MRLTVTHDIDDSTGVVIAEEYWKGDKRHRDGDQPAIIVRDAATGQVACEAYLKEGGLHRDGGMPAVIQRSSATGRVVREEYWKDGGKVEKTAPDGGGQIHRLQLALERFSGSHRAQGRPARQPAGHDTHGKSRNRSVA